MSSVRAFADALSATFTNEEYPLGSFRPVTDDELQNQDSNLKGEATYIFVKATTVLAQYDLAELQSATASYEVKPCETANTSSMKLCGVAQVAIALNSYGWILARGEGTVKTDGVAAGAILASDGTSGRCGTNSEGSDALVAGRLGRAIQATTVAVSRAYIDLL